MPQTSAQRNRPTAVRPQAPQPLADSELAETEDHEYALVSVLYHALQGAQACEQYMDDAERAGEDDLVTFFQECRDEQTARAARAKQLLVGLAGVEEEDEEVDDEEEEEA